MKLSRFHTIGLLCLVLAGLTGCMTQKTRQPEKTELYHPVSFAEIPGWQEDKLHEAWPAFMASCRVMQNKPMWQQSCQQAAKVSVTDEKAIRQFFETWMQPYQIRMPDGSEKGLATGYYEPLLRGSRKRTRKYTVPLYRVPDDLLTVELTELQPQLKNLRLRGRVSGNKVIPYYTRAEIENGRRLAGKELLWVDDPLDAFFLHIQGSGRVHLADTGETVRVAYANQNGHPYRSIGKYLADKGEMRLEQTSMQGIRNWLKANPARLKEVLHANAGPKGAQGVALTPERSVAIDPSIIPLGAPLFLNMETAAKTQTQRLVMAQDTGGAIRGSVRVDYFCGFGDQAGIQAGKMKQAIRLWVLLPKSYRLEGEK